MCEELSDMAVSPGESWVKISVVTIASEPASIDYDRSFEKKNRDVDVDSMSHGHVD